MDACGRKIDYLRISVTDRCNERCLYCRPTDFRSQPSADDHLTAEEIIRVARMAVDLGFRKFRLTGGEPLLRRDILQIARGLKQIPGVETIGLSTNGTRLAAFANCLREAGVRTVNVSLDALNPMLYRHITGGNVADVLAGIRTAVTAGFERVKLNCVLLSGQNEAELWPLVLFAAEHGLPLRLIELMPLTRTNVPTDQDFLSTGEAMRLLAQLDELIPQPDWRFGHGPARYYLLKHTGAMVGFIGALTAPHFCAACNKVRLTADGKIRSCLGDCGELDLRAALRGSNDDQRLRDVFLAALRMKPSGHQFHQAYQPVRPMVAIGG